MTAWHSTWAVDGRTPATSHCGGSGCSGRTRSGSGTNACYHLTRTREFLRAKGDELVRWAQQQIDLKLVETCEAIAKQLRSAQMVANVVGLARSNPEQVATVEQWDANPFELGAPKPGRTTI